MPQAQIAHDGAETQIEDIAQAADDLAIIDLGLPKMSGLDVIRELGERGDGRTLILITHRLSTLAGMDRIVVLDGGRVVEQGTHAELLAAEGVYRRLVDDFGEDEEVDA